MGIMVAKQEWSRAVKIFHISDYLHKEVDLQVTFGHEWEYIVSFKMVVL